MESPSANCPEHHPRHWSAGRFSSTGVHGFLRISLHGSLNTATSVMMLPIGLAIISKMEDAFGKEKNAFASFDIDAGNRLWMLDRGVSTLVGTPTNLAFVRIFQESFPKFSPIAFGQWILIGIPYSVTLLLVVWLLLTRVLLRVDNSLSLDNSVVEQELAKLGPITCEEKTILSVFITTALAMDIPQKLELGFVSIPGWSDLWTGFAFVDDGSVAVAMCLLLFFLPVKSEGDRSREF